MRKFKVRAFNLFKMTFRAIILLIFLISCGSAEHGISDKNMLKKTNLPYVKIITPKTIKDEPKTPGIIKIIEDDKLIFESNIGVEIRGASSQLFSSKKSYGFEFKNQAGQDTSLAVFNMPKNKDWILYGPYSDPTLIKNILAYQLSNNLGHYAPKTQIVELEINDWYKGIYVWMEKPKRGKNRIETGPDSTGLSFILKIDKTVGKGFDSEGEYNDTNSFGSKFNVDGKPTDSPQIHFLYEYPKSEKLKEARKREIQDYINQFETGLAAGKDFTQFIDEESFIDNFLLNELAQNFDAYRISTFIHKPSDGKLKMGPIWDFDLAFGSSSYCDKINRKKNVWVFQYNNYCGHDPWLVPFWWKKLLANELFRKKLTNRWFSLRKNKLSESEIFKIIDENYKNIQGSGGYFNDRQAQSKKKIPDNVNADYKNEIENLKAWLTQRLRWIDEHIEEL